MTEPEYKPVAAIHHQLRLANKHIYQELGTDKFFGIQMVGVENSQRGRGVATELIRRFVLDFSITQSKENQDVSRFWVNNWLFKCSMNRFSPSGPISPPL